MTDKEMQWRAALSPEDPEVKVFILADRIEKLTKEKEALEVCVKELTERIDKMEKAFDRGSGVLLVLPVIGTILAFVAANWRTITKPWINQ